MDNDGYTILKLREEISNLNKQIEWYRHTYEERSLFGIIKTRLLPNFLSKKHLRLALRTLFRSNKKSTLKNKTYCAIVNYNCNDNARKLRKIFSQYFDTQVIDSGSSTKDNSFINLPNVYYSGLYNHAYNHAISKGYEYILFICSDVIIEEEEAEKMFQNLSSLNLNEIGVYSPSSTGRSHYQCKKKNESGLRVVDFVEGFFFFASLKMLSNFGNINTDVNLYGWGIDVVKGFYSKKMGLLSVIDDGVSIYHPEETGYSTESAEKQMLKWFESLPYGYHIVKFHEDRVRLIRSGLAENLKISVIIPCYNQSQYLKQAIFSVFSQTYSDYEIIIVNDGSTDNTDGFATFIKNQFNQVKYIKQSNKGLGTARNTGLDAATGNFIQFLDADDYLSDNKFSSAIQTILNNEKTKIIYSNYICFEDGNVDNTWTYSRVQLNEDPLLDIISQWEKELSIPMHCFLFKAEIIGATRFDSTLPNHEDWEFHISIAAKKPNYEFSPDAIAYYRIKKTAMSQDQKKMKDGKNRCIANVVSSKKIKDTYLSSLYERFDYKIAIGILTCNRNTSRISIIRETWVNELKKHHIPYYFIIGNPELNSCKLEGDTIFVPCPDDYESLPKKMFYFYNYIFENTNYDFVYKIDDDCFLNVDDLYFTYFWNFDYFGHTVCTDEKDLNRAWHFGKCTAKELNNKPYPREYTGPWCGGGFGYFLSRIALGKINTMGEFIKADMYEDKAIGDALRENGILPQENPKYIFFNVEPLEVSVTNEDAFKELISLMGYDVFKYTIIMELKKDFQFLQIQQKRDEMLSNKLELTTI
jgi:glycosyltransferase involved in cell wall biosynthesis